MFEDMAVETETQVLKEAKYYEVLDQGRVHCYLCPKHCKIWQGLAGFCFIRKNIGGKLYSLGYGRPAAVNIDPIEKKPLFHFLPGTRILSMGTAGCNMGCKFCQNWDISKAKADQVHSRFLSPEAVVEAAVQYRCPSIAFTYNEPTIFAEYVVDTAMVARERGVRTVMVTNGYITAEARREVYRWIDAANVDLKGFTREFYRKITLSTLEPVLETLCDLQEMGIWIEITNLMIPGQNDSEEETWSMCRWIVEHLGNQVPVHFTAFHPDFKMTQVPHTPETTLRRAREIALESGIQFVYEGNVFSEEGSNTYCPRCHRLLIRRSWHQVVDNGLCKGNQCSCGEIIPMGALLSA